MSRLPTDTELPVSFHSLKSELRPYASITLRHGEAIIRSGHGCAMRCSQATLAPAAGKCMPKPVAQADDIAGVQLINSLPLTVDSVQYAGIANLPISALRLFILLKDLQTRASLCSPLTCSHSVCRLPAYPSEERVNWDIEQTGGTSLDREQITAPNLKFVNEDHGSVLVRLKLCGLGNDQTLKLDAALRLPKLLLIINQSLTVNRETGFSDIGRDDDISIQLLPAHTDTLRRLQIIRRKPGEAERCSDLVVASRHLADLAGWLVRKSSTTARSKREL